MGIAPDGHHIRMMEPGEAEQLYALASTAGLFADEAPDLADFVVWLLHHEIFVAEARSGRISGFAAARDATDLYWLSDLAIDPAFKGMGLRRALVAAVVARAGWFFHRAVGLAVADEATADWYRRRRFLAVAPGEEPGELRRLARERPGRSVLGDDDAFPDDLVGTERTVMVHWL
jgi:4-diphosphocytidyl-2-C-methyl-D-erythritol kinase